MERIMAELVLIEDDEDDIYFFKEACSQLNRDISITVLRDGWEFIDYVENNSIKNKVFLLDLNMPKLGGLEALDKLQSNPRLSQMVIVTYTTSSRDKDIKDAYKLGVKSYLLKPNSMVEIMRMIETVSQYWFTVNSYSEEVY